MNESRDSSFEVLSTMSPKVDRTKKKLVKKRGPTKLALRKQIRRSSFFDKLPATIKNSDIIAVELTSTDSSSVNSSELPKTKKIRSSAIYIPIPVDDFKEPVIGMPTSKYHNIKNWIADINTNENYIEDNFDTSTFSQISVIQGNLQGSTNGAANSTFVNGKDCRLFDEFLRVPAHKPNFQNDNAKEPPEDFVNAKASRLFDELLTQNNSNVCNMVKQVETDYCNYPNNITNSRNDEERSSKQDQKNVVSKINFKDNGTNCNKVGKSSKDNQKVVEHGIKDGQNEGKTNKNTDSRSCVKAEITASNQCIEKQSNSEFFSRSNQNPELSSKNNLHTRKNSNSNQSDKSNRLAKTINKTNPQVDRRRKKNNLLTNNSDENVENNVKSNRLAGKVNNHKFLEESSGHNNQLIENGDIKTKDIFHHIHNDIKSKNKMNWKNTDQQNRNTEISYKSNTKKYTKSNPKNIEMYGELSLENSEKKKTNNPQKSNKENCSSDRNTQVSDVITLDKTNNFYSDNEIMPIEDSPVLIPDNIDYETNKSKNDEEMNDEYEKILDELYGAKWRKSKDIVLPRSEPRSGKFVETTNKKQYVTQTEVKPRNSVIHKNPYLDMEATKSRGLLRTLQVARMKTALESPWVHRLQSLCDPESDESPVKSTMDPVKCLNDEEYSMNPRTKLNFDDEFEESDENGSKADPCIDLINKYVTTTRGKVQQKNNSSYDDNSFTEIIRLINANEVVPKIPINYKPVGNFVHEVTDKIKNTAKQKKLTRKSSTDSNSTSAAGSKSDASSYDSDWNIQLSLEERLKGKDNGNKKKTNKTKSKKSPAHRDQSDKKSSSSDSSDSEADEQISSKLKDLEDIFKRIEITATEKVKPVQPKQPQHPCKTTLGVCSFLASLSGSVPLSRCDPSARIFRNCYKTYRAELLMKLFKMYNEKIFDKAIPEDVLIEWNDRLRGTAGYCSCSKITRSTGIIERKVRFVLSTKVLDSADRLRDTLVHEMCHAATWIVNKVSDGHGPHWKSWAAKAMKTFPELPPIKRCHDYSINTKYTYKCTKCDNSVGRHTKSINLEKKRCGICFSKFEVFLNKKTKDGGTKSVATPKKEPTKFALFVKENYANYKSHNIKHGDVMKILGQKYKQLLPVD